MKNLIKLLLGNFWVKNVYKTDFKKNVLIVYIVSPFKEKNSSNYHQNKWQVIEITKLLKQLSYNIDIVDYRSPYYFNIRKKYDLLIDILPLKKPIYKGMLKSNCIKIAYMTGSNPRFANNAELDRLESLSLRRGAKLIPRRQSLYLDDCVKLFNSMFVIGNNVTASTYNEFNMSKVFLIPNTINGIKPIIDFDHKRSNYFLYFGSAGCVHKGLDLLLEVFSEIDISCKLFVCGSFKSEEDFVKEYDNELFHCSNVEAVGFIDPNGETFRKLASICTYSILPSCSEGQAGSVLTCMEAGLIPLCSKECGFDEGDVIILEKSTKDSISKVIKEYSNMSNEWIVNNSLKYQNIASQKYSQAMFVKSINDALISTIELERGL